MRYVIVPSLVGTVANGWTIFFAMDIDTYAVIPGSDADKREDVAPMVARYWPHSQEVVNDRGAWVPVVPEPPATGSLRYSVVEQWPVKVGDA